MEAQASKAPNRVLRGIREKDRHETRPEFAEAMARVAREIGEDVYPDENYVQRLESGAVSWPNTAYRNILVRLCGRPAVELGFTPPMLSAHGLADDSGESPGRMNIRLRDAIWASGMELTEFARRVGVAPKTAERWITRGRIPLSHHRWKSSQILGCDESEFWPEPIPDEEKPARKSSKQELITPRAQASDSTMTEEGKEEMERRRLLQSLAALGVQVSPLNQALETVRTAFGETVGYNEANHLDSWEETVAEYGYSYISSPPLSIIPNLASDLVAVRSIIRRIPKGSSDYRGWCRVGGALSVFMAKSLSNLGQPGESRQWWEMALHMTDTADDVELGLWLRGQRIIHGLYENRPLQVLLRQFEGARDYAHDYVCAGNAEVSVGGAQVSVLYGDYQSAEVRLRRASEILSRLPSSVTNDTGSVMGWGEAQLRYAEAWVYSHMGNEAKTDRAADRALQLYPESDNRSPAQIRLMQAFARIQSGDISEGIRCARTVYEPLGSGQCTTMVDALAQRVLNSVPFEAQKRSDVAEYRALVAPATRKMIEP